MLRIAHSTVEFVFRIGVRGTHISITPRSDISSQSAKWRCVRTYTVECHHRSTFQAEPKRRPASTVKRLAFPRQLCEVCRHVRLANLHLTRGSLQRLTMDTATETDESPNFLIFQQEDMNQALQPLTEDQPRKKRVHRKSRLGCLACKRRRVKVRRTSKYISPRHT